MKYLEFSDLKIHSLFWDELCCVSIIELPNQTFQWRTYNKVIRRGDMVILEDMREGISGSLGLAKRENVNALFLTSYLLEEN